MKQTYLIHEHHPRLILFFAGWAADETPFSAYRPTGYDLMICYDYRSLEFNTTPLAAYQEVNVIGWSMGVWAATQTVARWSTPPARCIAINGTPYPTDDRRGIPESIYNGTLEGLSGASLHKFLRRMCADSTAFRAFLEVTPRRPLEELREELACIARHYRQQGEREPLPSCRWTEAVIGRNDRIIPPGNQLTAWNELGVPVRQTEDAHYQESLFRHYLQDRWTND